MAQTITLDALAPRSPEYTARVASALAECVQVLNHATAAPEGIGQPAVAHEVLVSLHQALAGLPQLFGQVGGWLHSMAAAGLLSPAGPADVPAAVAAVIEALDWGEIQIGTVTASLLDAQQAAAGLTVPGRGSGPQPREGGG
jgi:hypothetical protein